MEKIQQKLRSKSFLTKVAGILAAAVTIVGFYQSIKDDISSLYGKGERNRTEDQQTITYLNTRLSSLEYRVINLEMMNSYLLSKKVENNYEYKIPQITEGMVKGARESGVGGM